MSRVAEHRRWLETELSRPMSARSVLLSVLLGTDGAELPAGWLVAAAEALGVSEGAARTALSRMTDAGDVAPVGDAKYRIGDRHRDRLARQRRAADQPEAESWDGRWVGAVVTEGGRPADERADLRRRLTRAGLAEWREGLWIRPGSPIVAVSDDALAWVDLDMRSDIDAQRALAAELWSLKQWADRAQALVQAIDTTPAEHVADAFSVAASVVRHLAAEPRLPSPLVPSDWPADALAERYRRYERAFQAALAERIASHRGANGA